MISDDTMSYFLLGAGGIVGLMLVCAMWMA